MTSQAEFLEAVENWARLYFFQSLTDFFNYLKHTELSLLQGYALTYLYSQGPKKISELCEHMMVSPGAASQMVDRLEKLEMVARSPDPEDRRVRRVILLDAGKRFVEDNFTYSQNWLRDIPTNISPEQAARVTAILSSLIQSSGKTNPTYFDTEENNQ